MYAWVGACVRTVGAVVAKGGLWKDGDGRGRKVGAAEQERSNARWGDKGRPGGGGTGPGGRWVGGWAQGRDSFEALGVRNGGGALHGIGSQPECYGTALCMWDTEALWFAWTASTKQCRVVSPPPCHTPAQQARRSNRRDPAAAPAARQHRPGALPSPAATDRLRGGCCCWHRCWNCWGYIPLGGASVHIAPLARKAHTKAKFSQPGFWGDC